MGLRVWAGSLGVAVLGATFGMGGCFVTPEVVGTGGGGAATTSKGGAGGGAGAGGDPACSANDCPNDVCNDAICEGNACGLKPIPGKACGDGLQCNKDGKCVGCDGDASKCDTKTCHTVACVDDECIHTPDGSLTCGDAQNPGTCDAAGNCGLCGDGIMNGDETGPDCGPAACGACQGEACDADMPCDRGFCVDSVCCDTACDGNCEGCREDLTGAPDGACAPLLPGTPDDAPSPSCGDKGGCGMHGACACEDGELTPGEAGVDCGGICLDPMSPDPKYCHTGSPCVTGDGNDCLSDHCIDGFCCNEKCEHDCVACDQPGLQGLCLRVTPGSQDNCPSNQSCSVSGECKANIGATCTANKDDDCVSGKCFGGQCAPQCADEIDCSEGELCENGFCLLSDLGSGVECWVPGQCAMGSTCVDGVCCTSECDGKCMACNGAYTNSLSGNCSPISVGYDPKNECMGTGSAAYCSGTPPMASSVDSACGAPLPSP